MHVVVREGVRNKFAIDLAHSASVAPHPCNWLRMRRSASRRDPTTTIVARYSSPSKRLGAPRDGERRDPEVLWGDSRNVRRRGEDSADMRPPGAHRVHRARSQQQGIGEISAEPCGFPAKTTVAKDRIASRDSLRPVPSRHDSVASLIWCRFDSEMPRHRKVNAAADVKSQPRP